jgi:hypothetical protein
MEGFFYLADKNTSVMSNLTDSVKTSLYYENCYKICEVHVLL